MAYLLLSEDTGTTRLTNPILTEEYGDPRGDEYPEVEEREFEGETRRVIRVTQEVARRLTDSGVGEQVLAEGVFEQDEQDAPDDSDGDGEGDEAETSDDSDDEESDESTDDTDDTE